MFVSGNGTALVKISGDLVQLDGGEDSFAADPITIQVRDTDDDNLQDFVISAGPDYEAGFRGQYTCTN